MSRVQNFWFRFYVGFFLVCGVNRASGLGLVVAHWSETRRSLTKQTLTMDRR